MDSVLANDYNGVQFDITVVCHLMVKANSLIYSQLVTLAACFTLQ